MQKYPIIAFLLKTYQKDHRYIINLCSSFNKYNVDSIPLYLVCESEEMDNFKSFGSDTIHVIDSKVFNRYLAKSSIGNLSKGYANQEIIKLCFWEFFDIDFYFCIDSDLIFINNFYVSDFIISTKEGFKGYTFFSPERDLLADPRYSFQFGKERQSNLEVIKKTIGLIAPDPWTTHGFSLFNRAYLETFKDEFLTPLQFEYIEILEISPYEFSWYNYWIQHRHRSDLLLRESVIRTFHSTQEILSLRVREINIFDLSQQYIGIVINSNFARNLSFYDFDSPIELVLGYNFSFRKLSAALMLRFFLKSKQLIKLFFTKMGK
jgi:hypothetical protein